MFLYQLIYMESYDYSTLSIPSRFMLQLHSLHHSHADLPIRTVHDITFRDTRVTSQDARPDVNKISLTAVQRCPQSTQGLSLHCSL